MTRRQRRKALRSAEVWRDAVRYREHLVAIAADVDRKAQHARKVSALQAEVARLVGEVDAALAAYYTKWSDDARRAFDDVHRRWTGKENELKALRSAGA